MRMSGDEEPEKRTFLCTTHNFARSRLADITVVGVYGAVSKSCLGLLSDISFIHVYISIVVVSHI